MDEEQNQAQAMQGQDPYDPEVKAEKIRRAYLDKQKNLNREYFSPRNDLEESLFQHAQSDCMMEDSAAGAFTESFERHTNNSLFDDGKPAIDSILWNQWELEQCFRRKECESWTPRQKNYYAWRFYNRAYKNVFENSPEQEKKREEINRILNIDLAIDLTEEFDDEYSDIEGTSLASEETDYSLEETTEDVPEIVQDEASGEPVSRTGDSRASSIGE